MIFKRKKKNNGEIFNAIKALVEEANPDLKIPTKRKLKVVYVNGKDNS